MEVQAPEKALSRKRTVTGENSIGREKRHQKKPLCTWAEIQSHAQVFNTFVWLPRTCPFLMINTRNI